MDFYNRQQIEHAKVRLDNKIQQKAQERVTIKSVLLAFFEFTDIDKTEE